MLTAASVMISASSMARHVHHEAVADAARGAQPRLALHHRAHQLVGVQAALHQRFGLGLRAPARTALAADSWLYGASTMRNREMSSPSCAATSRIRARGSDEDRRDQPELGGVDAPRSEVSSHG